ncbi:DUF1472 domain-containing protein [Salmonella enterica subsp. enterica serovar Tennessee]|nr:DUF1472 domain-containing protein [Salmonella enterica subsp. enterica serovar Tennessee]
MSNVPCGLRLTPCLYYSRAAADAREAYAVTFTRSQFISKAYPPSSRCFPAQFSP